MIKKTSLFLIASALLLFTSCQTKQTVYDLRKEADYAHKQGDIFAVDLLQPEGESYVMGGWSPVRNDGTRLGVYPVSRIKIPVIQKEPLYLFFKCEPFARDEIPAEGFRFRIRINDITQVELAQETKSFVKVALLPEILEWGDNVLQIYHVLDEEIEGKINPEENKRIRTTIFYEMLLSSNPDYELTKKYLETKKNSETLSSRKF